MADPPEGSPDRGAAAPGGREKAAAPLALGDDLAASILRSLEPLRFREAVDPRERQACFRLRHRAVREFDARAAERMPDGLEQDGFDPGAVQILGSDASGAIATCRLVLPEPGRPLPTEREFGLRISADREIVEVGRVVVDPGYRGDGHSILMGLIARAWLSMRDRGFTAAIGATPGRLVDLFDALGFQVSRLGPARMYWGEMRYPFLCEGGSAVPEIARRWMAIEGEPPPDSEGSGGPTGPQ
ncbi:MAG: GNAT family N-acyltransferase [Gemmatimonadota bacterium]